MATEIRANEKQPDCHKIDRSSVISKYVGETEKRLNKIFLKEWPNNLMLFLDEADVVFDKGSTVKIVRDLHDGRHEKRTLMQNVLEIHRSAG
jgi:SpoVK/Ycf46/Vps4 family AAA+-type ATPase